VQHLPLVADLYEEKEGQRTLLGSYPVHVRRRSPGYLTAEVRHSCGFLRTLMDHPKHCWVVRRGAAVLETRPVSSYVLGAPPPGTAPDATLQAWQFEQIAVWAWNSTDDGWRERFGVEALQGQEDLP